MKDKDWKCCKCKKKPTELWTFGAGWYGENTQKDEWFCESCLDKKQKQLDKKFLKG